MNQAQIYESYLSGVLTEEQLLCEYKLGSSPYAFPHWGAGIGKDIVQNAASAITKLLGKGYTLKPQHGKWIIEHPDTQAIDVVRKLRDLGISAKSYYGEVGVSKKSKQALLDLLFPKGL